MPNNPKDRWDKLTTISPFLALFVGAAITSWLIPTFTRQWAAEDHQKELELKSDLADQINRAITNLISNNAIKFNPALSWAVDNTTSPVKAFIDWQTSKEIIRSRIQTYFNDPQITKNWDNLSSAASALQDIVSSFSAIPNGHNNNTLDIELCNRLSNVLLLHASYPENNPINIDRQLLTPHHCDTFGTPALKKYFREVKTYFPINNGSIDWEALLDGMNAEPSYNTLVNDIENHTNTVIDSIFKRQITAIQ